MTGSVRTARIAGTALIGVLLALGLAVALWSSQTGVALADPTGEESASIDPTAGLAGTEVTVEGEGFNPGEEITILFGGAVVATSTAATSSAATTTGFTIAFSVPTPDDETGLGDVDVNVQTASTTILAGTFTVAGAFNHNTEQYFETIQDAVDSASTTALQAILVGPGEYDEVLTIDKAVSIVSTDGAARTTIAAGSTSTAAVSITAPGASLGTTAGYGGFTVRPATTTVSVIAIDAPGPSDGLGTVYLRGNVIDSAAATYGVRVDEAVDGALIDSNTFAMSGVGSASATSSATTTTGALISIADGVSYVTVEDSDLDASGADYGITIGPGADSVTIVRNDISNAAIDGVLIGSTVSSSTEVSLGAWEVMDQDLNLQHPNAQGTVIGDCAYVVSGEIQSRGVFTEELERAHLLGDGALSAWEVVGALPTSQDTAAVASTDSNIYVIGNHPGDPLVRRVPVNPDCSVGSAFAQSDLNQGRYAASAFVHGQYLYVVGGANLSVTGGALDSVERALIDPTSGDLGPWATSTPISPRRESAALVTTDRYVWLIGGMNSDAGLLGTIQRASLLDNGEIGEWEELADTVLAQRSMAAALAVGDCILVFGGPPELDTVECIRLDANEDVVGIEAQPGLVDGGYRLIPFADDAYVFVTAGASDPGAPNGWLRTERSPIVRTSGTSTVPAADVTNVVINSNNIVGNGAGVRSLSGSDVDARYNYWGDASGPSGDGPDGGSGDAIAADGDGAVWYDPWLGTDRTADPRDWYVDTQLDGALGDALSKFAGEDAVWVYPGTYVENIIITTGSRVSSTEGPASTTITAASSSLPTVRVSNTDTLFGGAGAGFTVNGASVGVMLDAAPGAAASGNIINPDGSTGVDVSDSAGASVSGNTIDIVSEGDATGVSVDASENAAVSGNDISIGAGGDAAGVSLAASDSATVSDNSVSIASDGDADGVSVNASDNAAVSGNSISLDSGGDATGVSATDSSSAAVSDNTIAVVADGDATSISIDASDNATISDNDIRIAISGASAASATSTATSTPMSAGVDVSGSAGATVSGNTIDITFDGDADGVSVDASEDAELSGNDISIDAGGDAAGVSVAASDSATVSGNTIQIASGGDGVGIAADSSDNLSATDNAITVNDTVMAVGATASADAQPEFTGVSVSESSTSTVANNAISVDATAGVSYGVHASSSPALSVADNDITTENQSSGAVGVRVAESDEPSVTGNTIAVKAAEVARGVGTTDSPGATVSGNTIESTSDIAAGIAIKDSADSTAASNDVTVAGGDGPNNGIVYRSSPNGLVSDNSVTVAGAVPAAAAGGGPGLAFGIHIVATSTSPVVDGNTVDVSATDMAIGVAVDGSDSPTVSNNTIHAAANEARGVVLKETPNATASGNTVTVDAGDEGKGIGADVSPGSTATGNTVSVASGGRAEGVVVAESPGSSVTENPEITAHSDGGDAVGVGASQSDNVSIDNNPMIAAETGAPAGGDAIGVSVGESFDPVVEINTISAAGEQNATGVSIWQSPNATVQDNNIDASAPGDAQGVQINESDGSAVLENPTINASAGGAATGVFVGESTFAQIVGNPAIAASTVDPFFGAEARGVHGHGSPDGVIDANGIAADAGTSGNGVLWVQSPDSDITNNNIVVTGFEDSRGIHLNNSDRALVSGNNVDVSDGAVALPTGATHASADHIGILVVETTSGADMAERDISGNTTTVVSIGGATGINLSSAPENLVAGNSLDVVGDGWATGIDMFDSGNVTAIANTGTVDSVNHATGIGVDNGTLDPGDAPVWLQLNELAVAGDVGAQGIALHGAPGSFIEGNILDVMTLGDATGIHVEDSPGTAIRPYVEEAPDGDGIVQRNAVTVHSGSAASAPVVVDLGDYETGTGIAILWSGSTTVVEANVDVSDPYAGVGVLVIDSPQVAVAGSLISVLAVEDATGVAFNGSDWFSLNGSTVSAEADMAAVGVSGGDSADALIGPMMRGGDSIGVGNDISAVSHDITDGGFSTARAAAGVVLNGAPRARVLSNNISAEAEVLADGVPVKAGALGVVGRDAPDIDVSGNDVSAVSGQELVTFGGGAEMEHPLFDLIDEIESFAATSSPGGGGDTRARSWGITLVWADSGIVAGNNVEASSTIAHTPVEDGVEAGVASTGAFGVSVWESPSIWIGNNSVVADAVTDIPIVADGAAMESFGFLSGNGFGASESWGVRVYGAEDATVVDNNISADSQSLLDIAAGVAPDGVSASADASPPADLDGARAVVLAAADGRGAPVGSLSDTQIADSEGYALSVGVDIHDALKAFVDGNTIASSHADVTAWSSSASDFIGADSESFAVGTAWAVGMHMLRDDAATVTNNDVDVGAAGDVEADSFARLPSGDPDLGPFSLADLNARAEGITIQWSKKVTADDNLVVVDSNGLVIGNGEQEMVAPALSDGYGFGVADGYGITADGVDRITVNGNDVAVDANATVIGVALSSGPAAMDGAVTEAAPNGWSNTSGIAIQGSYMPQVNRNDVDVRGTVDLVAMAEESAFDSALAQAVTTSLGIGVHHTGLAGINDNNVNVDAKGILEPRPEGVTPVEEVRQSNIEVFATGIEVIDAWRTAAGGNTSTVMALADSETNATESGEVLSAFPDVIAVTFADAAGIYAEQSAESKYADNNVSVDANADTNVLALTEAGTGGPGAMENTFATSMSNAIARGIEAFSSPETNIVDNDVTSTAGMDATAIASEQGAVPAPAPAGPTGVGIERVASTIGDFVSELSGSAWADGASVFDSAGSLIARNSLQVDSAANAVGTSIEDNPYEGDAFTFGSVGTFAFGAVVDESSDFTDVVDNVIGAAADGELHGLAEAVTTEDPLVLVDLVSRSDGIGVRSSNVTVRGNEADASASTLGDAFAHELIVPLEADAEQTGDAVARGIAVGPVWNVEITGNTVGASANAEAYSLAVEELLPSAISVSDVAAAARGIRFARDGASQISVVDNIVTHADANSVAIALADNFELPAGAQAISQATARGIFGRDVDSSKIAGNHVSDVTASAQATALTGGVGHPLDHELEVVAAEQTGIGVRNAWDIDIGGNTVVATSTVGEAMRLSFENDAGIWVDFSGAVRVDGNDVEGVGTGLLITNSYHVNATRNSLTDNEVGAQVVGGWLIALNFNDIAGNGDGVVYAPSVTPLPAAADVVLPTDHVVPLDATYNWWGDATGPSGMGSGAGDSISMKLQPEFIAATGIATSPIGIVYSPWLWSDSGAVLDANVGMFGFESDTPLERGWSTLSTPVDLKTAPDGDPTDYQQLGNIIENADDTVEIAYRYDSATGQWEQVLGDYALRPLDAVYVKTSQTTRARFIANDNLSSLPSRDMDRGWNLVGAAPQLVQAWGDPSEFWTPEPFPRPPLVDVFGRATMFEPRDVPDTLASVAFVGTVDELGWTQVTSPSINQAQWAYTVFSTAPAPFMGAFEGYWVNMENPDTLAGFSATPLVLPPWAPTD